MHTVSIRIDEKTYKKVKDEAKRRGCFKHFILKEMVDFYLSAGTRGQALKEKVER